MGAQNQMQCYRWLVTLLFVIPASGCVGHGSWGAKAALPNWTELRRTAVEVAKEPRVWMPVAGAAAFQIGGWDRKVSNWARDNTPVFGSQRAAQDWSDDLRTASSVAYFATVLATPDPDEPGPWLHDKAMGLAVQLSAVAITGFATSTLKSATGRTRPNGQGTNSFPSGHTSHAAVLNALTRDNLATIDMPAAARTTLDVGLDALTIGTAWARVEAGAHFPSDTLVSMALGNFISGVIDRAVLNEEDSERVTFSVTPVTRGIELSLAWRY